MLTTMKKIYSTPQLIVTRLHTERLIAESLIFRSGTIENESDVLVKDNQATSSNYNVWNDDWSD